MHLLIVLHGHLASTWTLDHFLEALRRRIIDEGVSFLVVITCISQLTASLLFSCHDLLHTLVPVHGREKHDNLVSLSGSVVHIFGPPDG